MEIHIVRPKINDADICLADNATTHTLFKDKKYFSHLTLREANDNTISSSTKLIEGFKKANILLPRGTKFIIKDALFSIKFQRNLLSFKDIRLNGYHIETMNKKDTKYLYFTSIISSKKCVLEKLLALSSGLY